MNRIKICLYGEAQQQLKTTEPASPQRGRLTSRNRNCSKIIKERGRKIGSVSQMGA
jgi:hypothetical protein